MTFSLQKAVQPLSASNLAAIANKKPLVIYVFGFDPSANPTTLPSIVTATLNALIPVRLQEPFQSLCNTMYVAGAKIL
uniref:Uncharacterized protein n=1 Tax=Romanomermis culicivorax TaxID=13658 RepID=A0A915IL97_ROMCU